MASELHNPWTTRSGRLIYDNPWISVNEYEVINPGGGRGIYGKVHFKNIAIGIIPVDDDLNTYLVGQYRYTLDQYSWEIVEGGGAIAVDPLESAKRELLEETGLTARRWERILGMHLSNSVSDEYAIVYVARELSQGAAQPEETEQLTVKKMPLEEAIGWVLSGKITDSMSVAGLLRLKMML
jgi:8-oxo-dGTP pyrophosphatase MutT (NUDIX family)